MYLIYTFFLAVGLIVSLPWYLIHLSRYSPSIRNRFGLFKFQPLTKSIWVHAVSVGEVNAVGRLLERLRTGYPDRPLVVSTVTATGQQLARERRDIIDHVIYFPLDLPWLVRRTLDRLDPEIVIIAETEIWPNFLRECRRRGIRVMMVNGRISDRSLPRYRLIRSWLRRVLNDYTLLGMQSEVDRGRIEMLGADAARVMVFGNLKYDVLAAGSPLEPVLASALRARQPLWIAASTTPGEEEFVLDAFSQLHPKLRKLTLLIAPRRPERFDEVEALIRKRGHACLRRTKLTAGSEGDVILLDTIGELASAFQFAGVVFMGGTLAPRGGHNVLEPARFSKPIVFGPHMENFREISDLFLNARAAIQIQRPEELAGAVGTLLTDAKLAAELGRNARRVVEQNLGATDRVMAFLQPAEARQ